jgi:ABC-type Mn2+/Zn2+ transport system permease subunit
MVSLLAKLYLAAILTASLSGFSSQLMTVSRAVMLGLALLHAVLAGSLVGIYLVYAHSLQLPIPLVSILFAILLALLAAELVERKLSTDAAVGIVAAISTMLIATFGYLNSILSPIAVSEAWSYVAGLSAIVKDEDLLILLLINIIVIPIVIILRNEFIYIAFDEDGAKAMGLRARFYRYTLYSVCAVVSASVAMSLGVFVSHVILVVPGALALKIARFSLYKTSLGIAMLAMLVGYTTAYMLSLPPSSGVGIVATVLLIITYMVKR